MARTLKEFCEGYLNDTLSPAKRKYLEERIFRGDEEVLAMIQQLKGEGASIHHPKTQDERFAYELDLLEKQSSKKKDIPSSQKNDDDDENYSPDLLPEIIAEKEALNARLSKSKKRKKGLFGFRKKEITAAQLESNLGKPKRSIAATIIGVLMIVLCIVIVYLQQERTQLAKQLTDAQEKAAIATENQRQLLAEASKSIEQLNWLTSLLREPQLDFYHVQFNSMPLDEVSVLSNNKTLKFAALIQGNSLSQDEELTFWSSQNGSTWQLLGAVDKIKSDSLYTNWNNYAMINAKTIEVRIGAKNPDAIRRDQTKLIGQIDLNQ